MRMLPAMMARQPAVGSMLTLKPILVIMHMTSSTMALQHMMHMFAHAVDHRVVVRTYFATHDDMIRDVCWVK